MADNFTIAGWESRPNSFTGLAFVPRSDAYVRRMGNRYQVGVLGLSDARWFTDLAAAKAAAQQLSGAVPSPAGTQTASPQAFASFWEPAGQAGQSRFTPIQATATSAPPPSRGFLLVGVGVLAFLLLRRSS